MEDSFTVMITLTSKTKPRNASPRPLGLEVLALGRALSLYVLAEIARFLEIWGVGWQAGGACPLNSSWNPVSLYYYVLAEMDSFLDSFD